jgi:glycerol-3-phosphate dehydrogenase
MMHSELTGWARSLNHLDVLVIGGGATGLGVAVHAALEGRQVALLEARDFASGTSSRSTKLLHGGVRYLAQGRVRLVREALRERAVVLGLAQHLAQPLPFVVAEESWRSWVTTVMGLKLYHWLSGRLSLGPTHSLGRQAMRRLLPSLPRVVAGVRYWDGQFDDARLALALAKTASAAGARLRNHTRVGSLSPNAQGWTVTLEDALTGQQAQIHARCVVNAAGVWVDQIRSFVQGRPEDNPTFSRPLVRPSQGVHLVVSRQTLPLSEAVLVPRTSDGRVLFAVPWLGATLIGTTDTPREDAPLEPQPLISELRFLLEETRQTLGLKLTPGQIQSVWVGLRPLVQSGGPQGTASMSREHLIVREAPGLITVTGGKWTTYRAMAEEVVGALVTAGDLPSPLRQAQTAHHRLWGAPPEGTTPTSLREAPGLHLLGSAAEKVAALPGHSVQLGMGLTESLVRYSARNEWAITVEDMLARRWRALFLDARAAQAMAPRVAELLQQETGQDPQLSSFLLLCEQYKIDVYPQATANPSRDARDI